MKLVKIYLASDTCTYTSVSLKPSKGGTMVLSQPFILKFMLKKKHCFTTLLTKLHVPLMHSSTLNINPVETLPTP